MIKAYILDVNGVFLKSELLTKRLESVYSVPIDESLSVLKEFLKISRTKDRGVAYKLWIPLLKKWNIKMSIEEFFLWWFKGETLESKVVEFCKQVRKKGIKVFILSNNFKERTEYYRKNLPEMFENVDKAYFSWETGFVKPEKKAFENVLKENNLLGEEIIYVDDSDENLAVARSLGIISYDEFEKVN